eukprot:TRINITY_DN11805_c0_g1_i7.p1 TRINITY_DN11805_c0_g1~~TRINITY_DN11805_c0_g1_i7.p1  ORF type:complete len:622 (-),score=95.68 TRINITY_DN11805_c0_g1_i7:211-2076(-)
MDLSWHLTYSEAAHGNPKNVTIILDDVKGHVGVGKCLPVLGPSGAGKTSLMNVLGGKVSGNKFQGYVHIGGKPTNKMDRTDKISFVEQHDMFLGLLTVREHMEFLSSLRLHRLSKAIRKERYAQILDLLGLGELHDRQIMVLSGGEKKRLSIAEELLNDPPIMILDEPTSQLDSHMAATVVSTLQKLAKERQKTILFTIHQPSSALFGSFDRVLFMAKGRVAYLGSPADLLGFLETVGAPCPGHYSVAEWTMEQISSRDKTSVDSICDSATLGTVIAASDEKGPAGPTDYSVDYAPFWVEICAIVKRTFIQRKRQRMQTRLNYASTLIISLIAGAIFFGVKDDQASIRNRTGAVFFLFVHPVFSAIFETSMPLVLDAATLIREYKSKRLYRVSSYYIARTTGEIPIQFSFPFLYCAIIYWMVYWRYGDFAQFIFLMLTVQLACFTGQSYGYMLSTLSVNFEDSLVIAIVFLVSIFLFSGMMIDITTLHPVLQALSNISLFKHAFDAGVISVWEGLDLQCDPSETCIFKNGGEVLSSYNIDPDNATAHLNTAFVKLAILSVASRLIGYARMYARYVFEDDWRNVWRRNEDVQVEDASIPQDSKASAEKPEVLSEEGKNILSV